MIRNYFLGIRARRIAESWCHEHFPHEPIYASVVCADEPSRFVIRVFCGERPTSEEKLPPWSSCVVIAVDKLTFVAERVVDDEPYRPIIM